MCSLDLLKYEILTHFGCNTNTQTVVKYTPECTYGYLGIKNLPGEDPRTALPIRRTFKIGPATPLTHYMHTFLLGKNIITRRLPKQLFAHNLTNLHLAFIIYKHEPKHFEFCN